MVRALEVLQGRERLGLKSFCHSSFLSTWSEFRLAATVIDHFHLCIHSSAIEYPSTDDEFIWFHSCRLLASPFVAGVVRVNHPNIQFGNPTGYVNKRSPKMADRVRMIYHKAS